MRGYVYKAAAAGGVLFLVWLIAKALGSQTSSGPTAVAGVVTSGSASTTIDTNVLSPSFGLPITTVTN